MVNMKNSEQENSKSADTCPCCKGAPSWEQYITEACIWCTNCGIRIHGVSLEDVFNRWNTRPSQWVSVDAENNEIPQHVDLLCFGFNGRTKGCFVAQYSVYYNAALKPIGAMWESPSRKDISVSHWQYLPSSPEVK